MKRNRDTERPSKLGRQLAARRSDLHFRLKRMRKNGKSLGVQIRRLDRITQKLFLLTEQ